jgi:hypothetical protein
MLCGPHSAMVGKTVENAGALAILAYDGQRMWIGPTPIRWPSQCLQLP